MKKNKINSKECKKFNRGITLIALVITIVVLIILAGVAINLSLGENGLFNKAQTAKEQYQNATQYEETEIGKSSNEIDNYISNSRTASNPNEISFANNNTGGFATTAGEFDFKSYGLTYKTFPNSFDDNNKTFCICKKEESRNLGNKFEISMQAHYKNVVPTERGYLVISLFKDGQGVLYMDLGEGNDSKTMTNYSAYVGEEEIGIERVECINGSERYAIVADGSNIHFYKGMTEIANKSYSGELSFDNIQIEFIKFKDNDISPIYLESLYIGEPYYYKDFVSND